MAIATCRRRTKLTISSRVTVLSVTDAHPIISVHRNSTCPPRHCLVRGPHTPCQDAVQVTSHRPLQATPVPRRDIGQGLHDTDALRLSTDLTGVPPSTFCLPLPFHLPTDPRYPNNLYRALGHIHGHRMPFRAHTRLLFTSCVAVVVCLPSPAVATLHSLGPGSRVLSKWTLVHLPIAFRRVFCSRYGGFETFGLQDDCLRVDETCEACLSCV
ncbi:hypothetical protein PLICRDRAFT_650644 [Plicaturopsis crispa FD-325 SS-3]|nr:hypothetical protein PLICRDRAFT_650644 [Plicaturopsis crispa FD-325 SS-3]